MRFLKTGCSYGQAARNLLHVRHLVVTLEFTNLSHQQ